MHFLSSFEFYLDLFSIILAVVSIALALQLISLVGKGRTWLLFAAALVLLAVDRVIEMLGDGGVLLDPVTHEIASDILGVSMIGCLLGSVYFIRDIFIERIWWWTTIIVS
jgi:hypothetical protein